MLQAGDAAPSFKLAATGGRAVDGDSLAGRRYLLYFLTRERKPRR